LTIGLWRDDSSIAVVSGQVAIVTGWKGLGGITRSVCSVLDSGRLEGLDRAKILANLVKVTLGGCNRLGRIHAKDCKS
jgi:hypothetical protein